MPRNRIDTNVRCPSCNGQLFPRVLVCDSCGLKIEGDFVLNEFGALTPDELHFLRVFIHCEGRIRDMEAALGVSYPTVKGHLASIKEKLNLTRIGPKTPLPPKAPAPSRPSAPPAPTGSAAAPDAAAETGPDQAAGPEPENGAAAPTPDDVLDALEQGRISYKDAVRLLRGNPPTSARRKKEDQADEQQPSG